VSERERENVPLIGPSVDRRTLSLVTRLANSETISSLACFACSQVHTHVKMWNSMYEDQRVPGAWGEDDDEDVRSWQRNVSQGDIRYIPALMKYLANNRTAFIDNFYLRTFKARYASEKTTGGNSLENATELRAGNYEWVRVLITTAAQPKLLCCPEDVRRGTHPLAPCKAHARHELCPNYEITLCSLCKRHLKRSGEAAAIPMALCNDNFWGYSSELIWKHKVRWIEAAIVSPCMTTMLVYYVEGDRGHLMNEDVGQQQFRTVVRGSCCSFNMPWEDILECLQRSCLDKELTDIPRPAEVMKYVLRVHMNVGGVDLRKTLKQLYVRPYVLLLLLEYLIDHNHEVFRGKGGPLELKQKMRTAVAREYPETEEGVSLQERAGHLPASILATLRESELELSLAARTALSDPTADVSVCKQRVTVSRAKHATPGDAAGSPDTCVNDVRPHAVCLDRSTQACTDPWCTSYWRG